MKKKKRKSKVFLKENVFVFLEKFDKRKKEKRPPRGTFPDGSKTFFFVRNVTRNLEATEAKKKSDFEQEKEKENEK